MLRSGARRLIARSLSTKRTTPLNNKRLYSNEKIKDAEPTITSKVTYDNTSQPSVKPKKRSNMTGIVLLGLGVALLVPGAYALLEQRKKEKELAELVAQSEQSAPKQQQQRNAPASPVVVTAPTESETVVTADKERIESPPSTVQIVSAEEIQQQLSEIKEQAAKIAAIENEYQMRLRQSDETHTAELTKLKSKFDTEISQMRELVRNYQATVKDYANEVKGKNAEIEQLADKYKAVLNDKQTLEENWNRLLEEMKSEHEAETQEALTQLRQQLTLRYVEMISETANDLSMVLERVFHIENGYKSTSKMLKISSEMHALSLAVMDLHQILQSNAPFKPEIDSIRTTGSGDPLVQAVVDSLPESVTRQGVPTIMELQQRFAVVSKATRAAAYIPENTGLIGYLYAKLVSFVVVPEHGLVAGDSVDARLARAEFYLTRGKLADAVAELDALTGLPATTVADWLQSAKQRLIAEQAARVLEAHVSSLTASVVQ